MAPIDPIALLKAFKPMLNDRGGIKNCEDVPRLSGLMKKYSKKLVSRCIYCSILLVTADDVLEQFLKTDGWMIINSWLKDSKSTNNTDFLMDLLYLLDKCPMTVARLKENDTGKIVKTLEKYENAEISSLAKEIVDRWMKLIKENKTDGSENGSQPHRKRKKSMDDNKGSSDEDSNQSTGSTSVKVKKKSKTEEDSNLNEDENKKPKAKVRFGKSRSIGIEISKAKCDVGEQVSSPQTVKTPNSIVLSEGFMDAIQTSEQTKVQHKKKKKVVRLDSLEDGTAVIHNEKVTVVQKDFEKDLEMNIEAQLRHEVNLTPHKEEKEKQPQSSAITVALQTPIKVVGSETITIKGILSSGRKSSNKKVTWVSDKQLHSIKYFELDETERINVSRPAFGECRSLDIRNEGQAMKKAGNQTANAENLPPIEKEPWRKLFLIELPIGFPLADAGIASMEKVIQEERHRTILPEFFPSKKYAPDFPSEPDSFEALAGSHEAPKIIPTDDENCQFVDYSDKPLPPPKTDEFISGQRYGDYNHFKGGDHDHRSNRSSQSYNRNSRGYQGYSSKKNTPCRFIQMYGSCRNANCLFLHENPNGRYQDRHGGRKRDDRKRGDRRDDTRDYRLDGRRDDRGWSRSRNRDDRESNRSSDGGVGWANSSKDSDWGSSSNTWESSWGNNSNNPNMMGTSNDDSGWRIGGGEGGIDWN